MESIIGTKLYELLDILPVGNLSPVDRCSMVFQIINQKDKENETIAAELFEALPAEAIDFGVISQIIEKKQELLDDFNETTTKEQKKMSKKSNEQKIAFVSRHCKVIKENAAIFLEKTNWDVEKAIRAIEESTEYDKKEEENKSNKQTDGNNKSITKNNENDELSDSSEIIFEDITEDKLNDTLFLVKMGTNLTNEDILRMGKGSKQLRNVDGEFLDKCNLPESWDIQPSVDIGLKRNNTIIMKNSNTQKDLNTTTTWRNFVSDLYEVLKEEAEKPIYIYDDLYRKYKELAKKYYETSPILASVYLKLAEKYDKLAEAADKCCEKSAKSALVDILVDHEIAMPTKSFFKFEDDIENNVFTRTLSDKSTKRRKFGKTIIGKMEIDLHGYKVDESITKLSETINALVDSIQEDTTAYIGYRLRIITGRGLHSEGGPIIKQAIKEKLKRHNIKFTVDDASKGGVLIASITADCVFM